MIVLAKCIARCFLVGGAALVLLGFVGLKVWRQRGAVKPAIAAFR